MGLKAEEVFSVSKKDDRSIATGFKTAYPNADGSYTVEFVDGTKVKTAPIKGDKGDKGDKFEYEDFTPEELADLKGDQGDKGDKGDKGVGIESITKRGTSGLVDTYLILFADGSETTFDVVNGANVTKTSQLENDSNFITNVVKNLINYYTKDEVYTKANIDELLRNIGAGLSIKIVPELPTEEISGTTIYLIKASGNSYTQYMWIDNDWANLGSTTVDLSNYYTKDKVDEILLGYVTMDAFTEVLIDYVKKEELAKVALSNDYNDLDNLPTIPEVEGIKPYSEVLQDSHNTAPTSKVVYDAVQTLEEEIGEKADADAVPEIDDESTGEDKVWSAKKINDSLVDKAEIDDTSTSALDATWSAKKINGEISGMNTNLGRKADKSYVDDNFATIDKILKSTVINVKEGNDYNISEMVGGNIADVISMVGFGNVSTYDFCITDARPNQFAIRILKGSGDVRINYRLA